MQSLSLDDVVAAQTRIEGHVARTPTLHHRIEEAELFLKAESLQPSGAFKLRGAFNMLATLPPGTGVVAHSSGNHAQAVARAAKILGLQATVVMPSDAPVLKRTRTEQAGARVIEVGPDSAERAQRAERLAVDEGLVAVPPFDHPLIAAGQGTAALEMTEQAPRLDRFYCPISGGGLMAGCATVFAAWAPDCEIIGVEPADANDTQRSLEQGQRVTVPPPSTVADGLRVRTPGKFTFGIVQRHVRRIETVTDDEILDAVVWALTHLRLILEPSGAASLAVALREGRGRCGVLLSGGNIDSALLAELAGRAAQR